jgi:ribosome-associated heat shock protein Hsp15
MRLDKFLWFVRVTKTRGLAQKLVEEGRFRVDGRPVERCHAEIRAGQVLTFAQADRVRVIRVETLPARRGPAPEARACYHDLAPSG